MEIIFKIMRPFESSRELSVERKIKLFEIPYSFISLLVAYAQRLQVLHGLSHCSFI